jgi:hypothetical protein
MEVVAPGVGAAVADRFLLLEITVQVILATSEPNWVQFTAFWRNKNKAFPT